MLIEPGTDPPDGKREQREATRDDRRNHRGK
jgi:hypothetical protein